MKILSSSGEMGWKSKALTAFVLGANLLNYGCSSTINEQVPEKTMEQHFKEMQEDKETRYYLSSKKEITLSLTNSNGKRILKEVTIKK